MNQEGLLEVLGGPRGLIDAGVPGAVFALAYSLNGQQLAPAIGWAVGSGVVLFVISLVERRPVQQALAGLVGVGVMAAVSAWTGQARDFYLPSVLKNVAYCAAYVISILVRWPLLGVFLGPLFGEGFGWRKDPARLRSYSQASAVWAAMFGIRVAVQVPLYLTGQVAALGFVGIPLGLPLFMLTLWVSYLILRSTHPVRQTADEPPSAADGG